MDRGVNTLLRTFTRLEFPPASLAILALNVGRATDCGQNGDRAARTIQRALVKRELETVLMDLKVDPSKLLHITV